MSRPGISASSPLARAATFGALIFGLNIFLNNMFIPVVFEMKILEMGVISYADLAVRAIVDILLVTAGVYLFEKISPVIGQCCRRADPHMREA